MYFNGNEISIERSWEVRKLLKEIYNLHITISPQLGTFQVFSKIELGFADVFYYRCPSNISSEELQLLAIDYCAKHILKYDILSKREYPDCS